MKNTIDAVCEFKAEWPSRIWSVGWAFYTISSGGWFPLKYNNVQICTHKEFNDCVTMLTGDKAAHSAWLASKNASELIYYTQEMANAGVQVEAGMTFSAETGVTSFIETGEYTAKYTNRKSIVFTDGDGYLIAISREYAKPITPPVKLINGEAYKFTYGNTPVIIGLYSKQNEQLQAIAGHYEERHCTNIKPLTLKGE